MTFEPPFDGLEIRVPLDLPAMQLIRISRRFQELERRRSESDSEEESEQVFIAALELFCSLCDGWNWTRNGEPVPLTASTLANEIPGALTTKLIDRWVETVRGVGTPLEEPSPDGGTSEEQSTETET